MLVALIVVKITNGYFRVRMVLLGHQNAEIYFMINDQLLILDCSMRKVISNVQTNYKHDYSTKTWEEYLKSTVQCDEYHGLTLISRIW